MSNEDDIGYRPLLLVIFNLQVNVNKYNSMEAQWLGTEICVCVQIYTSAANRGRHVNSNCPHRQLLDELLINKVQLITALQ